MLDLAQLNPVASHLDLLIRAPQKLQPAIWQDARSVPRSVEARARNFALRVGQKTLGGQVGSPQVAASQALSTEIEFALDACGRLAQMLVQDQTAGIGQRIPQGEQRTRRLKQAACRADRIFSWPIGIEYAALPGPAAGQFKRTGLARDYQRLKRAHLLWLEQSQRGRGQRHHSDGLLAQKPGQGGTR